MANTDPAHWFLDSSLIPRTPAYTSNNLVEPLIDGANYMAHINARLNAMVSGDYFHISGWRITPTQSLLGPNTTPDFLTQVKGLIAKGVVVRALVWYLPTSYFGVSADHPEENIVFVREIIKAGGQAVLDQRTRRLVFSAHHQKTIILSSNGEHYGYVGGMDICVDRWDTNLHNSSTKQALFFAWHDVACVVRGEAVGQIWDNFKDRWNDSTEPHIRYRIPASRAPGGSIPPPITSTRPAGASFGTHNVQVLRTLVCKNPPYPFAKSGEQTVRLAYEKAIDLAEHYIYIEEQYLWPCSLTSKLAAAAARNVKIILVLAHNYDFPALKPFHNYFRQQFLNAIQGGKATGSPSGVYPFHLEQRNSSNDIYVHSKLMIIDDRYVIVGTANINKRSFTTDSEIQLAIVDSQTEVGVINGSNEMICRFAKDLRIKLWQEHLGVVNLNSIDDPISGLNLWPDWSISSPVSPIKTHHAVCHYVSTPQINPALIPPYKRILTFYRYMANQAMNVETICS